MAAVAFSPYGYYEVDSDPYPAYARLREEAPVYRNDELDFWALSRHADVFAALRDPRRFSSANGPLLEAPIWGEVAQRALSFVAMDPPRHTRTRGLVARAFTPRRIAELEPRVRSIARHHIEAVLEQPEFDLISGVAAKVPTDVICELVGVPENDRAELRRLADLAMRREEGAPAASPASMTAALDMAARFAELVAYKRQHPQEDLTSALLEAQIDGDRLTDQEIVAVLHLLVGAGNETTTNLIGNAWYWAWRNPDQKAKALTGRVSDWVEETLRYDTAAPTLLRTLTQDIELHGVRIPSGARMLLLPGAANRDPDAFPEPDRYDLDRDTGQAVSFGSGPHFCLGASLARLEARVTLEELAAHITDYDLDLTRASRPHTPYVRGFSSLPTTLKR